MGPQRNQRSDAPIMKVNAQSRAPPPIAMQSCVFNLDLRKFDRCEFQPQPPNLQLSSDTTFPSSSEHGSTIAQPAQLKFVSTSFRNGKEIHQVPPREPTQPPRKRQRKASPREIKKSFSAHRPLQNAEHVHKDIWKHIFAFCEPKFLLEAKCIDLLRYDILSHHQAIWRSSRLRHFGPDCPPCPTGITEQQYVDLLVGRGCQIPSCTQQNTTNTTWYFLGRLCSACFLQKTARGDRLPVTRQHRVSEDECLWDALPQGLHQPRLVRSDCSDWAFPDPHAVFLKSDYDNLEKEYLAMKGRDVSDAEISQWWRAKKQETMLHMKEVYAIHRWLGERAMMQRSEGISAARARFFEEKAATLNPPISREELHCMAPFLKALRTSNPPSDRAWEVLLEKIEPHREAASKIAEVRAYMWRGISHRGDQMRGHLIDENLRTHRVWLNSPEQQFVRKLGEAEYHRTVDQGVSDADLLLKLLKNVFNTYEKIPEQDRPRGRNWDGSQGPYVLSLDDARMILQEVVTLKKIPDRRRRIQIHQSFRCPGCDSRRLFDFESCLEHVYQKHSQTVGEGGEFWRLMRVCSGGRNNFSLYVTPWPRCLPVLPMYCDPQSVPAWHPDLELNFVQEHGGARPSAFEGRSALWTDESPATFIEAFQKAIKVMRGGRLDAKLVVQIGLRYATEVCPQDTPIPSLDEFMEMLPAFQEINPGLVWSARCGLCPQKDGRDESPRTQPHRLERSIGRLYKHWKDKHVRDNPDWRQDFMQLLSDEDLQEEMVKNDEKLRHDQEKVKKFDQEGNVKKRPNPKAGAILATPYSMDAFHELYPEAHDADIDPDLDSHPGHD